MEDKLVEILRASLNAVLIGRKVALPAPILGEAARNAAAAIIASLELGELSVTALLDLTPAGIAAASMGPPPSPLLPPRPAIDPCQSMANNARGIR